MELHPSLTLGDQVCTNERRQIHENGNVNDVERVTSYRLCQFDFR
jgi:hypothetical protein